MQMPKINFYIWTPRDQRNYGTLSMTGTAKACDALIRAIEGGEGSHDFELAVPTVEEVEHIGSGVSHSFNWLRVTQDDTPRTQDRQVCGQSRVCGFRWGIFSHLVRGP